MKILPINSYCKNQQNNLYKKNSTAASFSGYGKFPEEFGQYLASISQFPRISRAEEISLAEKLKLGGEIRSQAREKLTTSNLRLVVDIALKSCQKLQLPLMDLIQEGNIGLYRATSDYNGQNAFATYAGDWIWGKMMNADAEKGRIIKLSSTAMDLMRKLKKVEKKYLQTLGREPSLEEISSEMNLPKREVKRLMLCKSDAESLDKMLEGADSHSTQTPLVELVTDERASDCGKGIDNDALRDALSKALHKFNERKQKMLKMYFGLDGKEPLNFHQIGKMYGISFQAVQRSVSSMLKVMKKQSGKDLTEFL